MTAWANNLNGITSGTTVTTGNSGGVSGTAFNTVAVPTGGSTTAESSAAQEGACGLQIVFGTSTTTGYVGWNATAAVGARLSASFWFKFTANPAANAVFWQTSPNALSLSVTSAGQVAVSINSGVAATSSAITAGTWVFVQLAVTAGTTTANGRAECAITTTTGASVLSYDSGTTANTGTNAISSVAFGRPGFGTTAISLDYDLLAADNTLVSGFPGTPPAPALTASPALTGTGTLTAITSGAPTATPNFSATGTLTTSAAVVTSTGKIKVWNGSAWVAKPLKVWNGSAWVTKPVKHWTGSAWVPTSY